MTASTPPVRQRRPKAAFRFRDTRLCFTLPATLGDRGSIPLERLTSPEALARWCVEAGLLAEPPAVDARGLEEAIALREAIQRVGEAVAAGTQPQPADVARINVVAASAQMVPQLTEDGGEVRWVGAGLQAALSRVARDAIDLFAGPLRYRVRICANPACAGLFVDESRPGTRLWCSMSTCGDQAKKQRIRQRQTPPSSAR